MAGNLSAQSKSTTLPSLEQRWVYLSANFQGTGQPEAAIAVIQRAKRAGYNGVLLTDYKFHVLQNVVDRYTKNLAAFKKVADELEMEIIPAVAPFGYSSGILAHNPNLAEGIPVIDLPMRIQNGVAQLIPPAESLITNGGFESNKQHQALQWGFQDAVGQASFIDTAIKHSGQQSLRFEELAKNNAPHGNGRISKPLKLAPWRQYHARVWIKTENHQADETRLIAIAPDGRTLVHSSLGVKPTQDWTQHDVVFNSLEHSQVNFYCGVWGGKSGKIWLDDVQCEEVAFLNMVRRDDCPLIVKDVSGNRYEEGKDFETLQDPKLGNAPWAGEFSVYHQPPQLKLTKGTVIKEGARLLVSYYHTVTVHDGQVACSLEHPEVFKVVERQVNGVEQLLHPKQYMLSHDEIRVANWSEPGRSGRRSAGQLLAENVQRTMRLIHQVKPDARCCIWSDMFDPFHNAVKGPYYLVNGSLEGSWKGLTPEMTIINWNSGRPTESLAFFDKLGCRQILAGYYDGDPASIRDWLSKAQATSTVKGAMYTTWTNNYEHLEAFARAAWGDRK